MSFTFRLPVAGASGTSEVERSAQRKTSALNYSETPRSPTSSLRETLTACSAHSVPFLCLSGGDGAHPADLHRGVQGCGRGRARLPPRGRHWQLTSDQEVPLGSCTPLLQQGGPGSTARPPWRQTKICRPDALGSLEIPQTSLRRTLLS